MPCLVFQRCYFIAATFSDYYSTSLLIVCIFAFYFSFLFFLLSLPFSNAEMAAARVSPVQDNCRCVRRSPDSLPFFCHGFLSFSLFYYLVAAAAVFASQSFFQICSFSFSFWQCFSFQLCQCFCCRCCCWSSAATLIRRHRTTLSQPLSI